MALELKFDICIINNCSNIQFKDTTGVYDVTTNPGGYGTPNINPSDGLNRKLTITDPSGIVYIINLNYNDVFNGSNVAINYIIPNTNIGGITLITDGQWKIVYSFNDVFLNDYTKTIYKYFYCNSEICVVNMLANLNLEDCDCNIENKVNIDNYIKTSTFLQSLKYAATCGNLTSFTYIKKIIDKLCKNNNCKTCN